MSCIHLKLNDPAMAVHRGVMIVVVMTRSPPRNDILAAIVKQTPPASHQLAPPQGKQLKSNIEEKNLDLTLK